MPPKKRAQDASIIRTKAGRACLDELNFFMGCGMVGFDRLQAVYTNILKRFGIVTTEARAEILLLAGLRAKGPKSLERVKGESKGWVTANNGGNF